MRQQLSQAVGLLQNKCAGLSADFEMETLKVQDRDAQIEQLQAQSKKKGGVAAAGAGEKREVENLKNKLAITETKFHQALQDKQTAANERDALDRQIKQMQKATTQLEKEVS